MVPSSFRRAVAQLVKDRIRAVVCSLGELRADGEGDEETVHRLRVATRRATAVLCLLRQETPRRAARWLRRRLRRLRQVASRVRDLEVICRRLEDRGAGKRKLSQLAGRQGRRELRPLVAEARRAGSPAAWRERMRRVARRVRRRLAVESPETWLRARVGEFAAPVARRLERVTEAAVPGADGTPSNSRTLHRFRIHVKRLRYAAECAHELAAPLAGPAAAQLAATCEQLRAAAQDLQERLGQLQDHRQLVEWLEVRAARSESARRKVGPRLQSERRAWRRATRAFAKAWDDHGLRHFKELLASGGWEVAVG